MAPITHFLFEEMASFNFRLESKTYTKMEEVGLTIETILRTLELTEEPNKYNFFLLGGLERKARTFVDNPNILNCYDHHNYKSLITIIVRYKSDPSPYDAQAPSAMESLDERRAQSGIDELQNPVLDPKRFLELFELRGTYIVWGSPQSEGKMDRTAYLIELFEIHPNLEGRVRLFIKDLGESCKGSRANLRSAKFPYFLGRPYFSGEEVADILGIPLFPGTLEERLEAIPEEEFVACPRLITIFLRAFNWNWRCIEDGRSFLQPSNIVRERKPSRAPTNTWKRLFFKLRRKKK